MPPKDHDAELIHSWLQEICYAWIGERKDPCEEARFINMRRFKLFGSTRTHNATLWFGTSENVPCDDLSFPDEEDLTYEINSKGLKLGITVIIWLNRISTDPYVKRSYSLYLEDKIGLLPFQHQNLRETYEDVQDIKLALEAIRSALEQHSL